MNTDNPLNLTGLHNIRKSTWQNLQPGSVILHGFTLNDQILPELQTYPVLTPGLIRTLHSRYRLLFNRQVIVADAQPDFQPYDISSGIIEKQQRLQNFNILRHDFHKEKQKILQELGLPLDLSIPLINSESVEKDYLIKDTYNSFSYLYGLESEQTAIPSLFDQIDLTLSIGDLLTNKLTGKFNIPNDEEVMLHLVVDYSRSMESAGKLNLVLSALEIFQHSIKSVLKKTKIQLYAFSDTCRPVDHELTGKEVKGGETNYATFMKKVLHLRDRDMRNKVILFTDGRPSDRTEAHKMAALFKKNKVDYTQIIFDVREEQREEIHINGKWDSSLSVDNIIKDEDIQTNMNKVVLNNDQLEEKMKKLFDEFTEIAETAGGNQIIVKINSLVKVVSVECYDRYMGLLTLQTKQPGI